MTTKIHQITISDLGLATLLITLGFKLIDLEGTKRISFVFEPQTGIDKTVKAYWTDQRLAVPIQSLFNNQKLLKNRIYSTR